MIILRKSKERGFEDHEWLQTYHSFSFGNYYDPHFINYRTLRVLNEDTLQGGKGFGSHSHKDMEIITYVLEGTLETRDSLGHTDTLRADEVQLLSAGSGMIHSEYNLSPYLPAHSLQIWIQPDKFGLDPKYTKKTFSSAAKWGQWCLICSRNGREGSLQIHQDVDLYATLLDDNHELTFEASEERFYWIQVISGKFQINETILEAGDSVSMNSISQIPVHCLIAGELLLFDLN